MPSGVSFGELWGEVVGKAEGESHEGEGGVGGAAGGEGGAAGDVEVGEAVDAEVGSDDAMDGIGAHAEAAHGVVGVGEG